MILIHWQSQAPPGVQSPAELLCVNVLLREALISLSASLLLSIHSSLCEGRLIAMATAVCFHLTRKHAGFEANKNNPHPRSCACRAAAKVRAHRRLMLQHTVMSSILGAVWSPTVQRRGQPAEQTLEIRKQVFSWIFRRFSRRSEAPFPQGDGI